MNSIVYEADEKQEETVSVFLMMMLEYAKEIGMWQILKQNVHVKMKEVTYSRLNKAQTVITSLITGCAHTKAINEKLSEEQAAANYLGMARFPDQSQINRYLTRFSEENVNQLGQVHADLFVQQSQARRAKGRLVVDIDQCGLVANGKSYELARKGYFPRKRGEQGYQLSMAYIGAYDEAVQLYLDPGNVGCRQRLPDLLRDIDVQLGQDNPSATLIRRLDAGYDSLDNRRLLSNLPGYFIMKGGRSDTAARLATDVALQDWIPVAENVHGTELSVENGIRRLLYEFYLSDGSLVYSILYTNLLHNEFGIIGCFEFYNQRQTIEAFFAQSRHVYNIQNMRSRQFHAIYAFLRFVFMTHNMIHWAKQNRLAHTEFANDTSKQLFRKVGRVRAHIFWDGQWHLAILTSTRWATALLDALLPKSIPIQLELPFARLYKT
jgi:Transposase DDE domain group 1